MKLDFHPITTANWPDYEALMESRGAPHNCWCTAWVKVAAKTKKPEKSEKKASMKLRIDNGTSVGILAYADGAAIGWCALAPRETYKPLGGVERVGDESNQQVWSIVCFFIKREFRGQGLTDIFLREAVEYAKNQGAKYIEAYPVAKNSPSYRFMGYKSTFEKAKFKFIKNAGARRHVMLRKLT